MTKTDTTMSESQPAVGTPVEPSVRRCWLLHNWSGWEDVRHMEKHSTMHNTLLAVGTQQNRRCMRCGQLDTRVAWAGV